MKNLTPLTRKMAYWDDIVNNKKQASRSPLQAIRQDVSDRFAAYQRHANSNTLENIPASPFVSPNIELLKGCYSKSDSLSNLKTKIKEKQTDLLRGECQYCNIGEPKTFDHYLPQAHFPEFSALSINLVPCCATCNTEKGEEWLQMGNRRVVHLYYDTLPKTNYLNCTIIYRNNNYLADFTLNLSVIPATVRAIIENHFTALNLSVRYKERSNSEIVDVRNAIAQGVGFLTKPQIQSQLRNEAVAMKASKGENYWRAVLRIALSNSNAFLADVGF